MTRELEFSVPEEESGETAEKFLKKRGFSHKLITSLKHTGGLTRGGKLLRTVDTLTAGDEIKIMIEDRGAIIPNPDIKAAIAFENEDVVVFDKPPGLAVHPSIVHYADTLGNLYAALYPNSAFRPVHRLDKDTSGLCACAKNKLAASLLCNTSGESERIIKKYFAVVSGEIASGGEIDLPIGRADGSIIKREVRPDGQRAVTRYKPILCKNGKTLLEITLKTGRTHQIRVHFAHLGFPLCGDEMYGGDRSEIARQALHCGKMRLALPTEETIEIESPLPSDIAYLLR
ncbi:MAG: RluA family pseudouridine synthase [Oscillospiraceae bacterium]|nr:RluA family pseudouridine synthase [Oscillospiraceae bacterium]